MKLIFQENFEFNPRSSGAHLVHAGIIISQHYQLKWEIFKNNASPLAIYGDNLRKFNDFQHISP